MRGLIWQTIVLMVLSSGSFAATFSDELSRIEKLLESKGYRFHPRASGIQEVSPDSHVLRAFLQVESSRFKKTVVVIVRGDSVTPVDFPVWAGDSVGIDVLDVNGDGHSDLIVNEYYEPMLNVRMYFGDSIQKFTKVLDAHSTTKPKFLEFNLRGASGLPKPVILTHDPYDLGGYVDLLVPHLYLFREGRYELVEKDCSPPK